MCENAVSVVFTDGEVDVVSCNHVQVSVVDLLHELPFALVLVTSYLLATETVPELKELDHILGRLFEDDETVDVPCIKPHSVLSVEYEFSEELECDKNDFVISVERVECPFDDYGEVVGVEPVEEHVKGL